MHLDPEFVTAALDANGRVAISGALCVSCYSSLCAGKRPPKSISTKHDLCDPARAGLPKLSLVESLCIARFRVLSTSLLFRAPTRPGVYNALKGSAIVFSTNAAEACAARMPDVEFVGADLTVVFEGSRSTANSDHLEGFLRKMEC